MDPRTFDHLTTEAARRPTRRATLRLLTSTILGGLISRYGAAPTRAAQIDAVGPPSADLLCAAQGLSDCGGFCIDVSTNPYNCGACGRVCGAGDTCSGGACVTGAVSAIDLNDVDACAAQGLTVCGGSCVDTFTDPANCGACGNSCPLGGYCQGGVCAGTVCMGGETDCGGYCADLLNDPANCGACHNFCDSGTCSGGSCAPVCFGGGSVCTDDSECCSGDCGLDEIFGGGVCV